MCDGVRVCVSPLVPGVSGSPSLSTLEMAAGL